MTAKLSELIRDNKLLLLSLLVVVCIICVVAICLFHYYQSVVAHATMQGIWVAQNVSRPGSTMMVIKDKTVTFEWSQGAKSETVVDEKATFTYKSRLALKEHRITLKRSVTTPFDTITAQTVQLKLYPTSGVMLVMDGNKEVMRLVKDNQFTIDHLQTT